MMILMDYFDQATKAIKATSGGAALVLVGADTPFTSFNLYLFKR